MNIERDQITVVTFDSFSTLVDPQSAGRVLEGYVDNPAAVAAEWHSLAVQFATLAAHVDLNPTYYELHRDALRYLLESHEIEVSDAVLDEMTDVYYDLSPFDDVRSGIESLSSAGYRIAILSNGNLAMLESLVETTDIGEFIETTISAAAVGTFKPDPKLYQEAAASLDVPTEQIVHIGAGWGDIVGCMNAGMQGLWLNRAGTPWPQFDGNPDAIADSMPDVVALLTDN